METSELKLAIYQAVENIPEDKLPNIFGYISSFQNSLTAATPPIDIKKMDVFFDKILKEDHALLKRLADNPVKRNS